MVTIHVISALYFDDAVSCGLVVFRECIKTFTGSWNIRHGAELSVDDSLTGLTENYGLTVLWCFSLARHTYTTTPIRTVID